VALLGLAYKIDTASTKNSPALALVQSLPAVRFHAYDPIVRTAEGSENVTVARSAAEAICGCSALVIATPWAEFAALDPGAVREALRGNVVIDPYAILPREACESAGLRQFVLGRPRPDAAQS
jgi:UDPglucose 6-dehydrogenase